jgi:hypothetical protein
MHSPGPWSYSDTDKLNRDRAFGINRDLGKDAAESMGVDYATETIAEVCGGCEHAEDDARLIAAAPEMYSALESVLSWLTNCNVSDPATLGRQIMLALEHAGYDKQTLDDAAVALVRGPCSVPNLMPEWEDDE